MWLSTCRAIYVHTHFTKENYHGHYMYLVAIGEEICFIFFFFCFLKFTLDMWIIYQLSSFVHNFLVESFSLKWSTVSTLPLWCIYVPTVSLINQLSYHIDGSTTAQLPRNQLLVFGHLTCLPSSFVLEIFLFILYYYW